MWEFVTWAAFIGLAFLTLDCVEVGRNDATNLVNAVIGARVLRRRKAVLIAGIAVVLGATFSSPVMETARKGIFDPTLLTIHTALAIYVSVYFVDTVILYGFSGFGMPVSTTACLVFELVGASLFLAGFDNVNWPKVGSVTMGIIVSILVSGTASFLIMRVFRGAIREKPEDRETLLLHGPWIAGAMLAMLTWFMIFKGLKNVSLVQIIKEETFQAYGIFLALLIMWAGYTLLTHITLVLTHQWGIKYLFHVTSVLGMICMAFAFGQNDLANAASPGLAAFTLWWHGGNSEDLAARATTIPIPMWALFGCGVLMAGGMLTQYAQRVTRAQVNTGSQFDHVALYAPEWCKALARAILRWGPTKRPLAPSPELSESGKKIHYDTLRASVIMGVSASVIAFASGRGLPVSTTYVAFAAVLGTGLSDRVFPRGDADLKIGRAIWVVFCWILAPVIGILATGSVALLVDGLSTGGLAIAIFLSIGLRYFFKRLADAHERNHHPDVSGTATQDEPAI